MKYFLEPTKAFKEDIEELYSICKQEYSVEEIFSKIEKIDLGPFEAKAKEYLQFSQSIFTTYKEEIENFVYDEHYKFQEYIMKLNYIYSQLFDSKIKTAYNLTSEFLNYIKWDEELQRKNVPLVIRENSSHEVQCVNNNGVQVLTDKASNIYKKLLTADYSTDKFIIPSNAEVWFKKDDVEFSVEAEFVFNMMYAYTKIIAGDFNLKEFDNCGLINKELLDYVREPVQGFKSLSNNTDAVFEFYKYGVKVFEYREDYVFKCMTDIHNITTDDSVDNISSDGFYLVDSERYDELTNNEDKLEGVQKSLDDIEQDLSSLDDDLQRIQYTVTELSRDL